MKEKIIEAAGKTWRALGEKGGATIPELVKILREREEIVNQAIGWLAREDKINYTTKNNATFVSLVEGELQNFKRVSKSALPQQEQALSARSKRS